MLLLLLPKLATTRSVTIKGVQCHVFSTTKLPGDLFGLEAAAAHPCEWQLWCPCVWCGCTAGTLRRRDMSLCA